MVVVLTMKDSSLDQANMLLSLQTQQETLASEFKHEMFKAFEAHGQYCMPSNSSDTSATSQSTTTNTSDITSLISNVS